MFRLVGTLAQIMHRFFSRSDESADLTRRETEAPANVLYGTLRRPTECNAGRADDLVAAVENLCIIRAEVWLRSGILSRGNRQHG
jgi:hypothetical protein